MIPVICRYGYQDDFPLTAVFNSSKVERMGKGGFWRAMSWYE
jgi:hypothetical protein